ncbi:MAG: hypothetical protein AVDCRST_MAG93-3627 [uncultured Chloroflexia bacterium]|uniref:Uncharacterized protein n=1 Tax=uncultured Chloroflexia bacterium TaxID=1672391 RepID=A0A6J4JTM0_9CHLR|nr:MAG: hypothetical protein AVDCRST_MAG93-3627 [uncultured Chloroflexia bacterium]
MEKKQVERYFVERFKAGFPGFPDGDMKSSEEPDFLIQSPTQTIGIELTTFSRDRTRKGGSSALKDVALRDKILIAAEEEYNSRSAVPILVTTWWNPSIRQRHPINVLAQSFVDIIVPRIPSTTSQYSHVQWDDFSNTPMEHYLSVLLIDRLVGDTQTVFYSASGGGVGVSPQNLQDIINEKNGKVPEYLKKCEEVWLLIVAGYAAKREIPIASDISPDDDFFEHVFESAFSRVFLYDLWKDPVELRTRQLGQGRE